MKTLGSTFINALALLTVAIFIGCGQGKQVMSPAANGAAGTPGAPGTPGATPIPGSTPLPTPPPLGDGATASLDISGSTVDAQTQLLRTYVGSTLNQTGPVQINIKLSPNGGVYLGKAHIRFYDLQYGQLILHNGDFENGTDPTHGNNVNVLTTESGTGKATYRIFFEDQYGAIIVTLQSTAQNNDVSNMTGKVWFKNFNTTAPNPLYSGVWSNGYYFPSNPYAYCWSGVITTGPYDCRNMSVQPSTTGTTGFTFLGTIPAINGHLALGI